MTVYGFGESRERVDVYPAEDVYNKTEADDKYRLKSDSYSKTESDAKYYSKTESDAKYYSKTDVLNKVYPVGSLYSCYAGAAKNPADIIGGTWVKEGSYMLATDKTSAYSIRVTVYRRTA